MDTERWERKIHKKKDINQKDLIQTHLSVCICLSRRQMCLYQTHRNTQTLPVAMCLLQTHVRHTDTCVSVSDTSQQAMFVKNMCLYVNVSDTLNMCLYVV